MPCGRRVHKQILYLTINSECREYNLEKKVNVVYGIDNLVLVT